MSTDNTPTQEPILVAAAAVADEDGIEAAGMIAVQGRSALLAARFADMDAAGVAYTALLDAERRGAIDIAGVLVADSDSQGKITVRKLTDHKTRNGFMWGAVAGAALAVIFPPSILAGVAAGGIVGAAVGKAGNLLTKGQVASELAEVITPNSSGIIAVVDITSIDAVKAQIPHATEVKTVPVDDATAAAVTEAAKAAGDETAG